MTHDELYKEFCEWSPEHASMIVDYKPWGNNSILIRFINDVMYKCKYRAPGVFVMQPLSKEDVDKKFGLN